jgi:hypothetical protein
VSENATEAFLPNLKAITDRNLLAASGYLNIHYMAASSENYRLFALKIFLYTGENNLYCVS